MEPYSEPRSIKLNALTALPEFLDTGSLSDIAFMTGPKTFKAHKIILAVASGYFRSLFFGQFNVPDIIARITDVEPEIFKLYLDLVYGKEIYVDNWKMAFKLFEYIDYTQTSWPTKGGDTVWTFNVPEEDFVNYIIELGKLYNGEIPENVLYDTPKHIRKMVDLSPLAENEDLLRVNLNSEYLVYGPSKAILLDEIIRKGGDPGLRNRI